MLGLVLFGAVVILVLYRFRHHLRDAWHLLTCRAHRLERTRTGSDWWVMVLSAPILTVIVGYILIVATRSFFGPPRAILIPLVLSKGHSLAAFIMNLFIAALLEEAVFRLLPLSIFVFLPLYIYDQIRKHGSFSLKLSPANRIWCGLFLILSLCGLFVGGFELAFAVACAVVASTALMNECLCWNTKPRLTGITPLSLLVFYIVAFSAMIIFALGHVFNYLPRPPMDDAGALQAWLMHGLSRFDLYPYVLPQFFSGVMFTVVYLRSPGRWMLPLTASAITHFTHNLIILVVLPLLAGMH